MQHLFHLSNLNLPALPVLKLFTRFLTLFWSQFTVALDSNIFGSFYFKDTQVDEHTELDNDGRLN